MLGFLKNVWFFVLHNVECDSFKLVDVILSVVLHIHNYLAYFPLLNFPIFVTISYIIQLLIELPKVKIVIHNVRCQRNFETIIYRIYNTSVAWIVDSYIYYCTVGSFTVCASPFSLRSYENFTCPSAECFINCPRHRRTRLSSGIWTTIRSSFWRPRSAMTQLWGPERGESKTSREMYAEMCYVCREMLYVCREKCYVCRVMHDVCREMHYVCKDALCM